MTTNLAHLLTDRRELSPGQRIGLSGATKSYVDFFDAAHSLAELLAELGAGYGKTVAVVGINSTSYLSTWSALQLAGAVPALLNPELPPALLSRSLEDLVPDAVIWVGVNPVPGMAPFARHLDAINADRGELVDFHPDFRSGDVHHVNLPPESSPPGLARRSSDLAGFMQTSGTSGHPKFCAQSHSYYLRMAAAISNFMCLSAEDTVFAPLPLFHVNPLGYGVLGGLSGGANVICAERFSARTFWPTVHQERVTALILHAPPVEVLKRATSAADAAGHRVRIAFFADAEFMDTFHIPLSVAAYGSTECGGNSHLALWRRGQTVEIAEGLARYAGYPRPDVESRLSDDGEILVRGRFPGVLFGGYYRGGNLDLPVDGDGWFATGDLGRLDAEGRLIFVERATDSIRARGEFVPIQYVEEHFLRLPGVADAAIATHETGAVGDEFTLFVVADEDVAAAVVAARQNLPRFMRPARLAWVNEIPRGAGVGKVQRSKLAGVEVRAEQSLAESEHSPSRS